MDLIYLLISFAATTLGSLCGIGGGVIIKPIMDSTGLLSVTTVSFLSSATVLSMAIMSVITTIHYSWKGENHGLALREGTPLAIGAAIGGILGKSLFHNVYTGLTNSDRTGSIQAGLLIILTISTIIYNRHRENLTTHHLKNRFWCIIIGLVLGMKSAFIGIGGGPINIVILTYLFSMPIKKATINSLYIIMFSQLAGIISIIAKGNVPEFSVLTIFFMCTGGVMGGFLGKKIHKKVSSTVIHNVFNGILVTIITINIYNLIKFLN